MKNLYILFSVFFILSVIGTAVFPSSTMILCNMKDMCGISLHQIDKTVSLFIGVFLVILSLVLLLFVSVVIENSPVTKIILRLFKTPHNVLFDYLKRALSKGIIEPQLYC